MKIFNIRLTICLLAAGIFNACTQKPISSSSQAESRKKPKIITSKGPYQASNTHEWDLIHTKLDLSIDWQNQEMPATAELTLKPWFYPQNTLVLDAKYMRIESVFVIQNSKLISQKFEYDSLKLRLNFDKTYQRNDSIVLHIHYVAQPNKVKAVGSDAITDNRGLYFINPDGSFPYKPRQVWSQGETESASCWFPTLDTPNEKTTQEMIITVEGNQTVLTNGKKVSSDLLAGLQRKERWVQTIPHAPYLFMIAIGEFAEVKDKWRDKPVNYYVEPAYADKAKVVFGNTPEMIEFYSRILKYPFVWDKYSQVVVRDFVSGAMENTSASVFMEELQCDENALADRSWDGIIAHELFHQWFGDIVTCESWANLPLNESFANYSEYLWYEYKLGRAEADIHDEEEEDQYLEEATERQDPLIRYYYEDKEQMFDAHSYNKGGRVLHMLRKMVGDEAFFESYHRYLKRNEFRSVEIHDLRLAFEEVTGQDLNWFFDQWFFKAGHAELKTSHSFSEGVLKISVEQLQDSNMVAAYRLPLWIEWWNGNKPQRKRVTITRRNEVIEIPMTEKPDNVIVDAEFQLLGKIFQDKNESEWIHQYQNCPLYKGRAAALNKLFAVNEVTEKLFNPFLMPGRSEVLKLALADSIWAIRLIALKQFSEYAATDLNSYLPFLEHISKNDPKPQIRMYALSLLASIDVQKYSDLYVDAMKAKSWLVQSTGLRNYLRTTATDKDVQLVRYENVLSWEIIKTISDYYISNKIDGKYAWFKDKLLRLNGRTLYYFIGYFGEYLRTQTGENRKDGVEQLKKVYAYQKNERTRKVTMKYIKDLE